MTSLARTLAACTLALAVLMGGSAGRALAAQRHFVASTGVDSNPCSIALPCRSFAAAALLVDPNGEIVVQDTAGYGFVTVTKPLSILSPYGVYAGISVFAGQDGITINAAGGSVRLTGVYINGQGGNNGILVQNASRVTVEGCSITNMLADGLASSAAGARIVIRNSVFRDNGGNGISIAGAADATIDAVHADRNAGAGIAFDNTRGTISASVSNDNGSHGVSITTPAATQSVVAITDHKSSDNAGSGIEVTQSGSGVVQATVSRSAFTGNALHGAHATTTGQGSGRIMLADSQLTGNGLSGVTAEVGTAVAVLDGNAITRNPVGAQGLSTGSVRSAGNNSIHDNTVDVGAGVTTYTRS